MNSDEVAVALKLSKGAFDVQLSRGTIIIPFIRTGRRREFLRADVKAYLENQYEEAKIHANAQLKKAS